MLKKLLCKPIKLGNRVARIIPFDTYNDCTVYYNCTIYNGCQMSPIINKGCPNPSVVSEHAVCVDYQSGF